MTSPITTPHLTSEGVAFTVIVDSVKRECLISGEALDHLSSMRNIDLSRLGAMDVFHAFEASISGVARRLVAAGVSGTPLLLNANTFVRPPRAI